MSFRFDTVEHSGKDANDVKQAYLIAGEDLTNDVLKVIMGSAVSASYSPTAFTNAGAATKAFQKATPGMLYGIRCSNANAATRYLQIHNKASAPAAGETAIFNFTLPAGTALSPSVTTIGSEFLGANGYFLSLGVSWAISTTAGTFTDAATAAEHIVNGTYY